MKSTNPHPSCKIYEGTCCCGKKYIGETIRNVETRWAEHNSDSGKSEPAKHLQTHPDHSFVWKIIMIAPRGNKERKYLEAAKIAVKQPELNNQLEALSLKLFRNGIT